jgi:D-3-phosphoglycerate dehydrogenase / 2-oxoglutarate reductase
MLKILANDGMEASSVSYLQGLGHEVDTNHYELDWLKENLKNYDAIVIRSATKLREELIDCVAGSRLKLMIRAGVGIDNIDVAYAESKGIAVRNTPNSSSASVAELAIAHIFSLTRFVGISNVTMRKGEWNKKAYEGTEVTGKTIGIIGFGRIGNELAKRAAALGMNVMYADKNGKRADLPQYEYAETDELLAKADIVSLHMPFIKEVGPVVTKETIAKMKDGAYIINTARGELIDTAALIEALDSGKLSGAGLDVFAEEPLKDLELANHPKVSVTPHIGGATKEAQTRIGQEVCDVIVNHFK